jgi:malonyl-CoA/methylmalonyl-CoA synthetase
VSANLFLALRNAFPPELDSVAIETADGVQRIYTWRDLDESSGRMANLLQALAPRRGARIAVQTDKSVDTLILYLAVLRSGNVFLPLNTAYQAAELEYFLKDAEPSVVVCAGKSLEGISRIARGAGVEQVLSLNDDHTGTLLERAAAFGPQQAPLVVSEGELAVILYTSGTTGRSKGAMLSHGNLLSNALTLKDYWGWEREDILIHALPIFHTHGLFVAAQGALLSGSRMIWFQRFDPKAVIARFNEATVFMGVPTLYVRMLQEPSLTREACRHMRLFVAGSAPLLPETFHDWRDRTHQTILERYGMSETVMLTSNPYFEGDGERRAGTVGFPLPGVRLRIAGEPGVAIAANEIGGIEVKGPSIFTGYWRAPELTREAFTADGWFRTGDVGKIDERGYVVIVGRSKDLIITGGYNVYPAEVESYLNELPGVAESAVIGVPHPDFGEAVIAVVVARREARLETSMLIAELKRKIAGFKVPKRVFVVEELPRNAMGKVQKALLRDRHKGLF